MMKKLIKKIKKKIKKWLARKIGVYTIEDIPPRDVALAVGRTVEPITLSVAVSTYTELFETETGLDFVKLKIKEAICDFAIKELPKCMSFTTETNPAGPYQIVRCQLNVVPPVDKESLADLLAEKETEGDKERENKEWIKCKNYGNL